MLQNDFYTINNIQQTENAFVIALSLNAAHAIFEGHFPQQPVVPGACMLQMVKEITAQVSGKSLRLIKADNLKFLMQINPNDNNDLQMQLSYTVVDDNKLKVAATLYNGGNVCFKFGGSWEAGEL